jgi:hypothetical protein
VPSWNGVTSPYWGASATGTVIGWYGSVEDAAASMTSVAATFQPEDRARASYEQPFIEVYRPLFLAIQPQLRQLARLRERLVEGGRT